MKKTLLSAAFAAALFASAPVQAAEKLTVLMDWFTNPDHAPLITAQTMGFFEAEGLDVELIEPADPAMPPKLVAAGQGDIAISYQPTLHAQIEEGLGRPPNCAHADRGGWFRESSERVVRTKR